MRYLALLFILLVSACKGDEPEALKKPDDLIPEEKMVQVLADVHQLEGALAVRSGAPREISGLRQSPSIEPLPVNDKTPLQQYDIFKKYDLTRAQYEKTMGWYTANPEELNAIYDKVLVELTKRQVKEQTEK